MDEPAGTIRSRMFAPVMGVPEDEATGSAATQLTARLGRNLHIIQGTGSHLHTTLLPDSWTTVGGRVVAEPSRVVDLPPTHLLGPATQWLTENRELLAARGVQLELSSGAHVLRPPS
nr:PhzF family phenazine biosynthesis protein [Streptomyces sp. SID13031]